MPTLPLSLSHNTAALSILQVQAVLLLSACSVLPNSRMLPYCVQFTGSPGPSDRQASVPQQPGSSLWATLPAACEELILTLLSQQAMAVLACVNRSFRDHVRATRVRKRALDISSGECHRAGCPWWGSLAV